MNQTVWALLTGQRARFDVLPHRPACTAQRRAAACGVPGRLVAKVVVVHEPSRAWYALAVLPATDQLDLARFRHLTGRPDVRLAREAEFEPLFPDCEQGALPPFGRRYGGLPVYLDRALAGRPDIIFEGGTHSEEIRMPMADYVRIERPVIAPLAAVARAA
jgi:Ala-tRNA(Pro) deacylase